MTFGDRVLVDTSLGTPTLGFGVASPNANRQATYVRGSGTNRLVFEYTVQRTDRDSNGIEFPASSPGAQWGGNHQHLRRRSFAHVFADGCANRPRGGRVGRRR